jgi:HlyD family secretion protein
MKRWIKIVIVVAVLAVIVVVSVAAAKKKNNAKIEVTVAKVERADLTSKVSANGKIEAQRKVDLSANVMGQIVNLAVREGDNVKKNDFLMQIDKTQLAASAAGAEASVKALFFDRDAARATQAEAQRNAERAEKNFRDKIISAAELDQTRSLRDGAQANVQAIETRIEQARAGLAGARDTLSKTTIRAPMSGIVTALPVEEGEVAVIGTMNNAGTVLMTISDMSVVEAVMQVDETDIPNVKIGQKAKVTVDAYPNRSFDGVVTEVGSSPIKVAGATGTEAINFEVKVQVENPPPEIRPGFSCNADIITGFRPSTVAIPIQALVVREKPKAPKQAGKSQDEEGVYRFDRTAAEVRFVPVKTGITGETSIELVSGINAGTEIVTGPFKALRDIKDGDHVRIMKEPPPGDAAQKTD